MTSSSLDKDLASIPIGDRLRQNIPKILSAWEKRLRQEIFSAEYQKSVALIEHIPGFLERLADDLSTGTIRTALNVSNSRRRGKEEAEEHGTARANVGQYVLHEVISEYQILREVIFNVLEAEHPMRPVERDIIL